MANSYEARQIASAIERQLGDIGADLKKVVWYVNEGGSVEDMDLNTLRRIAHILTITDEEMRQIVVRTSTAHAR